MLRSALVALLRNKMRSSLTVLGITIGIAAVICVVAIGKAGQARVEQQLLNLGDNFVWIEAGGRAVNGVRTGTHDTTTLTAADACGDQEPGVPDQERFAERRRSGPGRLRQSELAHVLPGRVARVLRHQAMGRRPGGRVLPGRRRPRRRRLRDRPLRARPALRGRGPDRQGDPRQYPSVQGRRDAGAQGPLALGPGPGRHGHPAVHDGAEEAQGSRRGSTTSSARRCRRTRSRSPARRRQRFSGTGITCARRRRTTSTSAIPRTSSRRSSTPAGR